MRRLWRVQDKTKTILTKADERNVHSQCGEDGVLSRIFSTLNLESGTAVEFGAWDGVHLSNTALLRSRGWRTVLIEADAAKVTHLRKLEDTRTTVLHSFVEPQGQNSLDALLDGLGLANVDLVSIDIDGDDLNIFRQLSRRPAVICIEFNPGIPPPHVFLNPPRTHKGSSIAAIYEAAQEKGYALVYATYCNALLVRTPDADHFAHYDPFHAFHLTHRPTVLCMFDGEFRVASDDLEPIFRNPASTVPVYVPRVPGVLMGWPPARWKVAATYLYCAVAAPAFYVRQLFREAAKQLRRTKTTPRTGGGAT